MRRIADIRRQVPEQYRAQFDELLGEARHLHLQSGERDLFGGHLGFWDHADRASADRPVSRHQTEARVCTTRSTSSTPTSTRCARLWSAGRAIC